MTRPILDVPLERLRRDHTSIKWRLHGPDVLPLWVAEMDARPCPPVVLAVTDAMQRGDTGYAGSASLAESFADYAASAWHWRVDPGLTVPVADVLTGIARLIELATDPGGPVVICSPVYNAFFLVIDSVGRRAVDVPLTAAGRLDLAALGDAFASLSTAGERAVCVLSSPHNPTGTVHTAEELTDLAALAAQHGVLVVSDEIHAPLVQASSTFTPYLTVPGGTHGVTVTSASKAWNLAALKAGLIVAGADAWPRVRTLHPFVRFGASHLGVIAQTAAWSEGGEWITQLLRELDANRRRLADLLAAHLPDVRMRLPESTYLAWLDCRDVHVAGHPIGDRPADVFRGRARVALSEGCDFGVTGVGCARLNFATSPTILEQAVERMAACVG